MTDIKPPEPIAHVTASASGLGRRAATGSGTVGVEVKSRDTDGKPTMLRISVGRSKGWATTVNAWVDMTPAKVHELVSLLGYLINDKSGCDSVDVGPHRWKHDKSIDFTLRFTTDICSVLHNTDKFKEEIIEQVKKELDLFPKRTDIEGA